MQDFLGGEIPTWVGFLGGVATTIIGLLTYFITRSDSKVAETFQSRELLRGRYAELSFEIMKLVGRLITPQTAREYINDAYRLDQLYDGEALLVPEPKDKRSIKLTREEQERYGKHWEGDDGSIYFALGVIVSVLGESWPKISETDEASLDQIDQIAHTPKRYQVLGMANAELSKRMRAMLQEQFHVQSGSAGAKAPKITNSSNDDLQA